MKYRKIILYILISYSLSYTLDFISYSLYSTYSGYEVVMLQMVWGFIRMYIPFIASYVVISLYTPYSFRMKFKEYINLGNKAVVWFLTAPALIYIPLFITIFSSKYLLTIDLLQYILKPVEEFPISPDIIILITFIGGYIAALSINSIYALGEEVGWRGFLFEELYDRSNIIYSGVIIGLIWGFWHTPIILLPARNMLMSLGVLALYIIWIIPVALVMNVMRLWGDSILPAISLHGAINALWGITNVVNYFEDFGNYVKIYLIGIFAWLLTFIVLYFLYLRYTE